MNYDLLQLSKILPTIKGKKTIEIYEESLEKARQQQANQGDESPDGQFYSPKIKGYNSKSKLGKAYIKFAEARSADKIGNNNLEESMKKYLNLQALLRGEGSSDSLTASVRVRSKYSFDKGSPMISPTNGSSSFRPTTSGVPPGNFVFRKKKINLREVDEALHIHHYALGTGINFLGESPTNINGRKVNVRETSTDSVVQQQKKYLKDLKQDPLTTFQGPNKDALSNDLNLVFAGDVQIDPKRASEIVSPTF